MRVVFLLISGAIIIVGTLTIFFLAGISHDENEYELKQGLRPLIRFNANGTLKIAIFADLHYGEEPSSNWGPAADIKSTTVINNTLGWEKPDFVVFTGDILTAENMYPNASDYIHIVMKPLVQQGYKWASTYGNHDIGPNLTRLELFHAEQTYSNLSYTVRMTNASVPGVTNYYLPIYPPGEASTPMMIWWFFDSQGGRDNDGQQPHYIDPLVIAWFKEENQKLKGLWGLLPSLVFFHIPPVEFKEIQENLPNQPRCVGLVDDDVTPQDNNTGIMQALTEAGGVYAVFVGHDHGNGWCCYYGEIQVCYARHTGYGGYGTWIRGTRIITLLMNGIKDVTIDGNYIITETGRIIDEFPHNDTMIYKEQ